jgi:hypothetical protein
MVAPMPTSLPGRMLLLVRFGLGTASWVAPRAVMSAIGMDPAGNPQAAYWARLFGVRDVVLGIGLLSTHGPARRVWWRCGILCDIGDAAAGVVSARQGELWRGRRTLKGLLAAAGIVGAGLGASALGAGDV